MDGANGVGVPPGGTAGQVLAKASGTNYDTEWVAQSGGGGGAALLAYVTRTAASGQSYQTTSTSPVDVDATNMAVTFTPTSAAVWVVLEASALGTGGYFNHWSLRQGTTNVPNSEQLATSIGNLGRWRTTARIAGLTPGASYTYKWAHRTSSASFAAAIYYGGTPFSGVNYGTASMKVYSA